MFDEVFQIYNDQFVLCLRNWIGQNLEVERKSMSRDSNFSHFLPTLLCQVSIGEW